MEGRIKSISSTHPLVEHYEKQGLRKVLKIFVGQLKKDDYIKRNRNDWVDEWKAMNDILFYYVYRKRGKIRPKGCDVYFKDLEAKDRHRIPNGGIETLTQINEFADNIGIQIETVNTHDIESVCSLLARIHYGFIRIHPFPDGNGRIARALTDQIAVSLGYPPVTSGYPRLNTLAQQVYHNAIDECASNPSCITLTNWIKSQIAIKSRDIA